MMRNHEAAIQKYRQHAATTQNEDVRRYATDMLPTLDKHLDDARKAQSELTQQR
jgi:hypothetical protein